MPANFALVTFGQSIPLILCRGDAKGFKERLRAVGRGDFRWFDIGSPPDGAGFYGVNPMALIGAETRPTLVHLNPRFYKFYDPANYHSGMANKYEVHFDYLRVGDRVSPLDYPKPHRDGATDRRVGGGVRGAVVAVRFTPALPHSAPSRSRASSPASSAAGIRGCTCCSRRATR